MTLQSSGPIKISQVAAELGVSANLDLNNSAVRSLFGKPSGAISLSNGYGKSKTVPGTYNFGPIDPGPQYITTNTSYNVNYYQDVRGWSSNNPYNPYFDSGGGSASPSPVTVNGITISQVYTINRGPTLGSLNAYTLQVAAYGNLPKNAFDHVYIPGWGTLYTANANYTSDVYYQYGYMTVWNWPLYVSSSPAFPAWTQLTFG